MYQTLQHTCTVIVLLVKKVPLANVNTVVVIVAFVKYREIHFYVQARLHRRFLSRNSMQLLPVALRLQPAAISSRFYCSLSVQNVSACLFRKQSYAPAQK